MRIEKTLVITIGDMMAIEADQVTGENIGTNPVWVFEVDFPLTYKWLKNNGELDLTDVDNIELIDQL